MKLSRVCHFAGQVLHKPRTFSGIQPTGTVHLGNYFGAVQKWVNEVKSAKTEDHDRIFSVVDLHAITMPQNPQELRENILTMTASLLGCGLDAKKAILFQQSHVDEHAQLCWILGTLSTVNSLKRLSQYKDKSKGMKETPLGLFLYPVLQAADILAYKATDVPVGEDNLQNVEMCRRLAHSFNNRFNSQIFPLPNAVLVSETSSRRIRSLRDPSKKMSKSDVDKKSCLYILDEPDTIRMKLKRAVTDMTSQVTFNPDERPGVSNLVCIHSQITNQDPSEICQEVSNMDTGQYKLYLADILIEHLSPIREKTKDLLENKDHIEAILIDGADRARLIAAQTLKEVNKAVGLH